MTAPDAPDAPRDLLDEVDEWLSSHSHTREAEPTLQLYRCADWLFRLVQRVRTAEAEQVRLSLTLTQRARDAEAETGRLRQFFEKCWDNARDGTDVEGSDVQDWGEQLGLLKPVEAIAPCGEGCYCAEYYGEFPATCYRLVWGASRPGEPQP